MKDDQAPKKLGVAEVFYSRDRDEPAIAAVSHSFHALAGVMAMFFLLPILFGIRDMRIPRPGIGRPSAAAGWFGTPTESPSA